MQPSPSWLVELVKSYDTDAGWQTIRREFFVPEMEFANLTEWLALQYWDFSIVKIQQTGAMLFPMGNKEYLKQQAKIRAESEAAK